MHYTLVGKHNNGPWPVELWSLLRPLLICMHVDASTRLHKRLIPQYPTPRATYSRHFLFLLLLEPALELEIQQKIFSHSYHKNVQEKVKPAGNLHIFQ